MATQAMFAIIGVLALLLSGAVFTVWVQCKIEAAERSAADKEATNEREGWKP